MRCTVTAGERERERERETERETERDRGEVYCDYWREKEERE